MEEENTAPRLGSSKNHEIATDVIRELEYLANNRGSWEKSWEDIARLAAPSLVGTFSKYGRHTEGEQKTHEMYDSTALNAANRFAAIVDSLLTPRNQTWHRLLTNDKSLNRARRVRLWFEEANRNLFRQRYAPRANFASQNQANFKGLGLFGTAGLFADKMAGKEKGLRYKAINLGGLYFAENHQGVVDTAYRPFRWDARQAVAAFGKDNLPDSIVKASEKSSNDKFNFIHAVKPNPKWDPERRDAAGKQYASYYVCEEGKHLIEEGGYSSFPYAISRYEQAPNEVYGRSPAMDALPAMRTLNQEKRTVLIQGERAVNPIYLMHDDGILDAFSAVPGSAVSGGMSAEGRPLVQALQTGNVMIGQELMNDERKDINDAFLVSLFQILLETPQMTATEVMERTKEKGILMAPTIGRQQSEYLGPLIERELDLLQMQGLLPPMPPELIEAQGEYQIEYDSPLSRAQRAEEASGLMRTIETAITVFNVTQDPRPLDHFNWDVIVPEVSEIQGVPVRWMNSAEEVRAMREGRAQAAETQQMVNAAPAAAAMVKAGAAAKKAGA